MVLVINVTSCGNLLPNRLHEFSDINPDSILNISGEMYGSGTPLTIDIPNFSSNDVITRVIDEVFDSVFVVKLETRDNCIIGRINQVSILNDTIYVRDLAMTKNICEFDMNGKFLRSIGNKGNGPFEYVEPTDMHVTNDGIIIYDQWQHKLIKYKHDGTPIYDKKIPFICNQVFQLKNGDFMFRIISPENNHLNSIKEYQLWHTDSTFAIKKVGLSRKGSVISIWNPFVFIRSDTEAYFHNEITDTLYHIDGSGVLGSRLCFKFPRNHSKEAMYNFDLFKDQYMSIPSFCFVNDNYLIYTVYESKRQVYVFENLDSKSTKLITKWNLRKSNLSRILHFEDILTAYEDFVVTSMPSWGLIKRFKATLRDSANVWCDAPDHVFERDRNLVESLTDDDNDVLVFFRLRNDL